MGHSISKLSVTGGQLYGLITDVQVMKNKMAPENGVKIGVWKWRVKCELYYFRFLPEDLNSPKWLNIQPAQKSKNNYLNYEWKNYELKFKMWNILRLVGDLSTWSNISRWEVYGAGDLLKVEKEIFFLYWKSLNLLYWITLISIAKSLYPLLTLLIFFFILINASSLNDQR